MISESAETGNVYVREVAYAAVRFESPSPNDVQTLPPYVFSMMDEGWETGTGKWFRRPSYWISNDFIHETWRLNGGEWIVYWPEPRGYIEVLSDDAFLKKYSRPEAKDVSDPKS